MMKQFRRISIRDALERGIAAERIHLRHDERGGEFALVADDDDLIDEAAALERVLDRLRRDVLSAARLEEVFFAIGDEEKTVFVQMPDVTCVHPDAAFSIEFERFSRCFGLVVRTAPDIRAGTG